MTYITLLSVGASENIKCLVIHCHGWYDWGIKKSGRRKLIQTGGFGLKLGQGITYDNADVFSQIRGLVKCIILSSCGIARVTNKNSSDGDGERFCARIAKSADAYVIAPRSTQWINFRQLPDNHIGNFEGEIIRFNRAGVIDGYGRLGRRLIKEVVS